MKSKFANIQYFLSQSISDVHCGLKILHRSVIDKINLTVNDFGIEIDLASQIVRNKFLSMSLVYHTILELNGRKKLHGLMVSNLLLSN